MANTTIRKRIARYGREDLPMAFCNELFQMLSVKKINDELAVNLYYKDSTGKALMTITQLCDSLAAVAHESNQYAIFVNDNLSKSNKVILRKVSKEKFEEFFSVKKYEEKNKNQKTEESAEKSKTTCKKDAILKLLTEISELDGISSEILSKLQSVSELVKAF